MNILFCIHSLSGGGAENQVHFVADGLNRIGNNVTVLYHSSGPKKLDEVILNKNVKYKKIPYSHKDIRTLLFIYNHSRRCDITMSWILQMDIMVGLISYFFGHVWCFREPNSEYAFINLKYKTRALLAKRSSGIIANSNVGLNLWENINTAKQVINNVVLKDNEYIPINNRKNNRFVYIGRLIEQKNVVRLTNLFNKMKGVSNISVYGDGNLSSLLHQSDMVSLKGYTKDVSKVLLQNEFFISLSSREGNPNSVLEAMKYGCKLVLSDIPSHREIFSKPSDGVFFVDLKRSDEEIVTDIAEFYNSSVNGISYDWSEQLKGRDILTVASKFDRFFKSVIVEK